MPIYQCVTSKILSPETKAAIAKEITRIHVEFTAAPEQPERNLILKVEEADPAVIMEAGLIMSRPGEEAAWLEANKTALSEALAAA